MKNFLIFFEKKLDFWKHTQYNLNVRESRSSTKNPLKNAGFKPIFDTRIRTLKIKQRRKETRNYFESICSRKAAESTQKITDVEKLDIR